MTPPWTSVTVTGTYCASDGRPLAGYVEFHAAQTVIAQHVTYFPARFVAPLDAQGGFTIALPATDDAALSNRDWSYRVVENVPGGRVFDLRVPSAAGSIDLASVAPVVAPPTAVALSAVARSGDAADLVGLQAVVDAAVAASSGSGVTQPQADARYVRLAQVGQPNGVAALNAQVVVPDAQIPVLTIDPAALVRNGLT